MHWFYRDMFLATHNPGVQLLICWMYICLLKLTSGEHASSKNLVHSLTPFSIVLPVHASFVPMHNQYMITNNEKRSGNYKYFFHALQMSRRPPR